MIDPNGTGLGGDNPFENLEDMFQTLNQTVTQNLNRDLLAFDLLKALVVNDFEQPDIRLVNRAFDLADLYIARINDKTD